MDPVSGALLAKMALPAAQGLAGFAKNKAAQKDAEINSFIGRTRAIQTDTVARENLSDEMGSMRAVFASNAQRPGVGTLEVMQDLRGIRDRERRIEFGNRMSESAGFSRQARASGSAANFSLLAGAARAGPSIFDYAQYRRKQNGNS